MGQGEKVQCISHWTIGQSRKKNGTHVLFGQYFSQSDQTHRCTQLKILLENKTNEKKFKNRENEIYYL